MALGASTGEVATDVGTGVDIDLGVGDALSPTDGETWPICAAACIGFTKVLGGAFGGGVDSDFILARTLSAA